MRNRTRRGRAGGIVAVGLSALIALALLLYFAVFVVRDIHAEGSIDLSEEEVLRASGIRPGTSIFSIDREAAMEGMRALGSIVPEAVDVRYPSTVALSVHIRPRKAMVYVQNNFVLIDENCIAAQKLSTAPEIGMPYVSGLNIVSCVLGERLGAESDKLDALSEILRALDASHAAGCVSQIDVADAENLRIITPTGLDVLLGDRDGMVTKTGLMKSAVEQLSAEGHVIGTLDITSGEMADYSRQTLR